MEYTAKRTYVDSVKLDNFLDFEGALVNPNYSVSVSVTWYLCLVFYLILMYGFLDSIFSDLYIF